MRQGLPSPPTPPHPRCSPLPHRNPPTNPTRALETWTAGCHPLSSPRISPSASFSYSVPTRTLQPSLLSAFDTSLVSRGLSAFVGYVADKPPAMFLATPAQLRVLEEGKTSAKVHLHLRGTCQLTCVACHGCEKNHDSNLTLPGCKLREGQGKTQEWLAMFEPLTLLHACRLRPP